MRKKLKNGISILLTMSMLCLPCQGLITDYAKTASAVASAETAQLSYTLYDAKDAAGETVQKASITGFSSEPDGTTALIIPKQINGYPVGQIADQAFKDNLKITSIQIAEGVDTIGYQSFMGCTNVTVVYIPSSITQWNEKSYNNSAFEDCSGLTELMLEEDLKILGQRAFAGCTSLKNLTIPSSIETFMNQVFADCTSLEILTLREGIKQIGHQAFLNCNQLKEVTIPSTIRSWGVLHGTAMATPHNSQPFKDCTSLEKITFPEGLQTLENFQGLTGCPKITELTLPSSIKNIKYAFSSCNYLKKVTLNDGLETIGESAFNGCTSLQEVAIPESVTTVEASAFYGCSSLKHLVFPPATNLFSGSVTYGCNNLQSICILADDARYMGSNDKFNMAKTGKIYCLEGSKSYNYFSSLTVSAIPKMEIAVSGYEGVYDNTAHALLEVKGALDGDEILYRLSGETKFQTEIPKATQPGTYTIDVYAKRTVEGEPPIQVFSSSIQAEIRKKTASIRLKDIEVREGEAYTIQPESIDGPETIIYTYYTDEALQNVCEKPTASGVYYVKARTEETKYYAAGESNVAKITIQKAAVETPNPDVPPTPTPDPDDKIEDVSVEKVTLKTVKSPKKKTITIQWKKADDVTGYRIQIATNKKFNKKQTYTIKGCNTVKKTIKKLKSKKKYYIRIQAYKTVDGKKHFGKFSTVKSVSVK